MSLWLGYLKALVALDRAQRFERGKDEIDQALDRVAVLEWRIQGDEGLSLDRVRARGRSLAGQHFYRDWMGEHAL